MTWLAIVKGRQPMRPERARPTVLRFITEIQISTSRRGKQPLGGYMRRSVVLPGLAALTILSLSRAAAAVNQGEDTSDFGYVVAINVEKTAEDCSAVLITPTWLLTAAHCFVPHGAGPDCGIAHGASGPFIGDFHVRVWLRPDPPFNSSGGLIPPFDVRHTTAASGVVFSRLAFLDECSEFDSGHDLALVQLDTRIPTFNSDPNTHLDPIRPLHPSLNGI
jgi:Trypsin